MTTEQTFLAAILAHPDDDTPRLVYADWLEEHGRPERAEFIRVQCKLAQGCNVCDRTGRNAISPCSCALLRSREEYLLHGSPRLHRKSPGWLVTNLVRWLGRDLKQAIALRPAFRRGFVESVECSYDSWLRYEGRLIARHPLRTVIFHHVPIDARGGTDDGLSRVTLWGRRREIIATNDEGYESVVGRLLVLEWPRLTFDLRLSPLGGPMCTQEPLREWAERNGLCRPTTPR